VLGGQSVIHDLAQRQLPAATAPAADLISDAKRQTPRIGFRDTCHDSLHPPNPDGFMFPTFFEFASTKFAETA
jgi:hypothetical protein